MTQAIPEKYRDLFSKRAFASLGTLMPDGRNEAEFCKVLPNNFILSLGIGLGKVART